MQQATANITDTIGDDIAQEVNAALKDVIANVTDAVEQFLKPLLDELALQNLPGKSPSNPAASCEEVKASNHAAPSGYYWIQNSDIPLVQVYCRMDEVTGPLGDRPDIPASSCKEIAPGRSSGLYWIKTGDESSIRVYCDMTRTCGGITGGWMQVANIDMTNSSHTCPQGLKLLTSPKRLCDINGSGRGCSSATFATHGTKYTHVCGKVIGYQYGSTTAFYDYYHHRDRTIDTITVGGVSLTHGSNPRKHIWTFAAAISEGISNLDHKCPCSNPASTAVIPPWVGNDYFCDSGAEERYQYIFYPDDPLWDGEGCGPTSTCCSFNNPPWFSKQLPSPTTDDIEMRLCGYNSRRYEDTRLEIIELYVQ